MIILTRHAKSKHNQKNIFAGNRLNTRLISEGKQEVKEQAVKIAKKYCFDLIICSDLKRSYQTAKIHQKKQKEKYGKNIKIIKTDLLSEVDIGAISGMTQIKAEEKYPNDYKNIQSKKIEDWIFTEGENPDLLYKRYLRLIKFIKKYSKKNILLVGHAMFNRFILKNWINLDKDSFDYNCFMELPAIKKSIMFFGWFFYPKVGGAETILLNQARELVKRGYVVSVVTSVLDDKKETEDNIFGIKVFRRAYIDSREVQNGKIISEDLSKIIKEVKPDIFHFHNGSYPSGSKDKSIGVKTILKIFEVIKKFEIPIIEHAHNAQLKNPETTKPLRKLPWDHLICVSDFVRQEWKKLGTNAKKMSIVYNGIDGNLFSKAKIGNTMLKLKKEGRIVLFSPARLFSLTTGELNKQKNLQLVFDALGILIKNGIKNFLLVSISNEVYGNEVSKMTKVTIKKIIEEKKLEGKVKFIPIINPDKMPEFYAGADIVCVPALFETFGLMYLEAMAAGKVVIGSNTGGPKEFIKNNKNGFFVDPTNAQELAELLKKLIQDKILRKKIGEQSIIDAKNFSIKSMVDQIESVYKNLV